MRESELKAASVRFGPFEVSLDDRELRRAGVRIKLQNQPFQILVELITRPGELIEREYLRKSVWSDDTFVDFEQGLNAAINKLRRALGDSAVTPHYIETVAGRGYRFLAPVEPIAVPKPQNLQKFDEPTPQVTPKHGDHRNLILVSSFCGILLLGIVVGWLLHQRTRASDPGKRRLQFTLVLPKRLSDVPAFSHQEFAVAPDGSRIAFLSGSQLWIHDLSSEQTFQLTPERNIANFAWSRDARSIYFSVSSNLRKVSVHGGASISICDMPPGTLWLTVIEAEKDLEIFTRQGDALLLPKTGGPLKSVRHDDIAFIWPQLLSRGKLLHVSFDRNTHRYKLWASNLNGQGSSRLILESDSRVQYTEDPGDGRGYLLYVRAGTLVAQPFDTVNLSLKGEAQPITEDVFWFQPTAAAAFSVSNNGVLAYRRWDRRSQLMWVDRTGRKIETVGKSSLFLTPIRLSPDQRQVAAGIYDVRKGGADLWIYDLSRHVESRLTQTDGHSASAVWAPDSDHMVFLKAMAAIPEIYRTSLSSRDTTRFFPAPSSGFQLPTDWSRDGRYLLYQTAGSAEPGVSVDLIDATRATNPIKLLKSSSKETQAVFSPDSRWLAYISSNTGQDEAYVQALSLEPRPMVAGIPVRASTEGASLIRWRADGKEIFFLDRDNWLSASTVETNKDHLRVGRPVKLFQLGGTTEIGSIATGFDVSSDGKRFLIADPVEPNSRSIIVVENWQTVLN